MYNAMPYMMPNNSSLGLLSSGLSFLRRINWSSFLSNTQKTLGVVNQAIPLYYQTKPIFQNLKSLSKITKEFNTVNNSSTNSISKDVTNHLNSDQYTNNNIPKPTFFI